MTVSGLIALGINIAGYAVLLLGGRTVLYGIANDSPRVDCFRNHYRQVLLGGRTVLHGIASISLRLISSTTSIAIYGFRVMYIIEYIYIARV